MSDAARRRTKDRTTTNHHSSEFNPNCKKGSVKRCQHAPPFQHLEIRVHSCPECLGRSLEGRWRGFRARIEQVCCARAEILPVYVTQKAQCRLKKPGMASKSVALQTPATIKKKKKMSILLTSKSISVKCPLQSVHCPNEKGLVCVSQKDLRSTLEPLVQPVILSAYERLGSLWKLLIEKPSRLLA